MKCFLENLRLSARNFGSVTCIAICGMLLGLNVLLGMFTLNLSPLLKIGFPFLTVAAAGMMFGPLVGGAVGALGDLLNGIINPTGAYFPGFTLSAFVGGFLYGLVLFRRPVKALRTAAARALVMAVVTFLLNPLWLMVLYGKAFWTIVAARAAANLVAYPVETALLLVLLKIMERCRAPQILHGKC